MEKHAECDVLLGRVQVAGRRLVGVVGSTPPGIRVPGSDWSVGDVVTHLAAGVEAYGRYLAGDPTPLLDVSDMPGGSLRSSNEAVLARETDRDLARLTARLSGGIERVVAEAAGRDLDERVPWHGRDERLRTMLGAALGELLVHGSDLAHAAGAPWDIDAGDARLVLVNIGDLLPLLVDPATTEHLNATIELRLRGSTPSEAPIVLTFTDGALAVTAGPAPRADVHISAAPVAFLLISYGRLGQWRPILTAKVVAWGRRPWIAPRLTRYLVKP